MMNLKAILAASMLLGVSNAHLFLKSPTPISGNEVKPPLDASGSDWPCHGVALPTSGGETMTAGSNHTLEFELGGGANTATHGGGSCQISITYETDPAKQKLPSSWKVIYSIEGGCPTNARGNLEQSVACTDANFPNCVNSFPFTIPKGVKDGHAILAWTWFNTIGNREMYMNCVNAQLTGGDGSEMDSFPDMFVANLASVGTCPTVENFNLKFPSPGSYVTTKTESNPYPLALPTGAGCPAASNENNKQGGQAPEQGSPSSTSSAPDTISTISAPTTVPDAAPSSASSAPAPAPAPSSPTASAAPAPSAPSTPAPLPPAPPANNGSCTDSQVPCPAPGAMICIDSTHFGLCNTDHCAISQPVAAGTVCKNGAIGLARKRGLRSSRHFGHQFRGHGGVGRW